MSDSAWETTLARWSPVPAGDVDLLRRIVDQTLTDLRRQELDEVLCEIEPPNVSLVDSLWAGSVQSVIAEVRVLKLRNPNPFPRIHLFKRSPK